MRNAVMILCILALATDVSSVEAAPRIVARPEVPIQSRHFAVPMPPSISGTVAMPGSAILGGVGLPPNLQCSDFAVAAQRYADLTKSPPETTYLTYGPLVALSGDINSGKCSYSSHVPAATPFQFHIVAKPGVGCGGERTMVIVADQVGFLSIDKTIRIDMDLHMTNLYCTH